MTPIYTPQGFVRAAVAGCDRRSRPSLRCCVLLAAEDVERDVRLVADYPAVMPGWDVEKITRAHHDLASVVHLGDGLTAQHEADMLDLARGFALRASDVLGPLPRCGPLSRARLGPEVRRTESVIVAPAAARTRLLLWALASIEEEPGCDVGDPLIRLRLRGSGFPNRLRVAAACSPSGKLAIASIWLLVFDLNSEATVQRACSRGSSNSEAARPCAGSG